MIDDQIGRQVLQVLDELGLVPVRKDDLKIVLATSRLDATALNFNEPANEAWERLVAALGWPSL